MSLLSRIVAAVTNRRHSPIAPSEPVVVQTPAPPPAPAPAPEVIPSDRFWIVWSPTHPKSPRLKQRTKAGAEMAAKYSLRVRRNPDEVLYVMQASSAWRLNHETGRAKGKHF